MSEQVRSDHQEMNLELASLRMSLAFFLNRINLEVVWIYRSTSNNYFIDVPLQSQIV